LISAHSSSWPTESKGVFCADFGLCAADFTLRFYRRRRRRSRRGGLDRIAVAAPRAPPTAQAAIVAIDQFPKQGSKPPWRLYQNYPRDILGLRFGSVEDGAMRFSGSPMRARVAV
jgi:hypothetical protein